MSQNVVGSKPDEVNDFYRFTYAFKLGPGVCSASNRNEYHGQKNNVPGE
jgi:hypothetical protein